MVLEKFAGKVIINLNKIKFILNIYHYLKWKLTKKKRVC